MVASNLFPLQFKPFPKLPTPSPFTFNFELTFMASSYQTAYFSAFLIFFVTPLWIKYTEHKPLGRLYMMCYPFFHEFPVIPSAKGFQLVHYSATVVYSPQRLYARGLTLIGVLLTLAGREGQWAMIFLAERHC